MSEITPDKRAGRRAVAKGSAVALAVMLVMSLWAALNSDSASPRVLTGWAMPNAAGTQISLHASPEDEPGEGYIIAGADWKGTDNVWHDGADIPSCVGTDTGSFTHVRLGLVTVEVPSGGSRQHVAWLQCLE